MKEGFCNSDHLSWKKGEHGKSRSEKKPLQVVDIDRKVEEKEQQGEDNDLGTSETIAMITMVTRLIHRSSDFDCMGLIMIMTVA